MVTQQKPNEILPLITVEAVDDTLILREKTKPNDEEDKKYTLSCQLETLVNYDNLNSSFQKQAPETMDDKARATCLFLYKICN